MTRTTHRSTAGAKLYAKRTKGQFTDIQTHRRSSRADQRVTTVEEATRVLVSEARGWHRYWKKYSDPLYIPWMDQPLFKAVEGLNTATRAAAKRKRARSVKP